MTLYRCIQRLQTADGVIHEVGDTVDLAGDEEQSAVRQAAVVASADNAQLQQLEQQRENIDHQIATMEHEGGPAS